VTKTFEDAHASVVYTEEAATGSSVIRPKLAIQVIDAYRYQRELSIEKRHRSGDSTDLFWEMHVYRHPGVRCVEGLPDKLAEHAIARILEITTKYPTLLFDAHVTTARCDGFVRLHTELLDHGVQVLAEVLSAL